MELGVGGATRVAPPQVSPRPILQTAVWSTWQTWIRQIYARVIPDVSSRGRPHSISHQPSELNQT